LQIFQVFGYSITEDILKKAFQSFGNVVNISMEIEKKYYPLYKPIV
jgi:hypothetical protein